MTYAARLDAFDAAVCPDRSLLCHAAGVTEQRYMELIRQRGEASADEQERLNLACLLECGVTPITLETCPRCADPLHLGTERLCAACAGEPTFEDMRGIEGDD